MWLNLVMVELSFSAQLTIEKSRGKEKENAELRQAGMLQEMNFICVSHDDVTLDVDCNVSTATLLVFIRQ